MTAKLQTAAARGSELLGGSLSSTAGERSLEEAAWGHGAFALALVEALQGKQLYRGERPAETRPPADARGVVTVVDLAAYVSA